MLKPEARAQLSCKSGSLIDFDAERFGQSAWQQELYGRSPEARDETDSKRISVLLRIRAFLKLLKLG